MTELEVGTLKTVFYYVFDGHGQLREILRRL